jgi:Zn-dependent protease
MNSAAAGILSLVLSQVTHEAGHWLTAHRLGLPVASVRPWAVRLKDREEDERDELVFLLGGPVANLLLCAMLCVAIFATVLIRVRNPAVPVASLTVLGLNAVFSAVYGIGNLIPLWSWMDGKKIWLIMNAVRRHNA